ncbi:hypothetical protein [Halostagnicola bangensis]
MIATAIALMGSVLAMSRLVISGGETRDQSRPRRPRTQGIGLPHDAARGVEGEDGDNVLVPAIDTDRWSDDLDIAEGDAEIDSVQFSGEGLATRTRQAVVRRRCRVRTVQAIGVIRRSLEDCTEVNSIPT